MWLPTEVLLPDSERRRTAEEPGAAEREQTGVRVLIETGSNSGRFLGKPVLAFQSEDQYCEPPSRETSELTVSLP